MQHWIDDDFFVGYKKDDGTYEIPLGRNLYELLLKITPCNNAHLAVCMTIGNVQDHDGSRIDDEAAVNDYMGRLKAMMGSIGWKVDDRGSKAFKRPFSEADIRFAKSMLERISYIDIVAIINAHRDDGCVMAPSGKLYHPDDWMWLVQQMNAKVVKGFNFNMLRTHQEIADSYAKAHKERFGKIWGPYVIDR